VKRIEKSSRKGHYNLMSYAGVSPMENMRVDWIAPVEWVKRG
jgi:hypothetical protein